MDFNTYQVKARETAEYPDLGNNFVYPVLGMVGEAGEVAEKIKKLMRDDGVFTSSVVGDEAKLAIKKELGDVLWYVAQVAAELGIPLEDVATHNLEKLASRKARGHIQGSGDNR